MLPGSDIFVPYRLRTIRLGVQSTWMVLAILPVLLLLPSHGDVDRVAFLAVWGLAAVGAVVVRFLPWARLFARGLGIPAMYIWSALDIVLITLLLAVVGPDSVDIFSLYALTTLFFAASYPPRGQAGLLGFTYLSYLTLLAVTGWPVPVGNLLARLGILGVMTFLAGFLSRELMQQIATGHDARTESDRRATLLRTVAGAARTMSFLDSGRVLTAVVDTALSLGFEAGGISFYDEETGTYRVSDPRGVPNGSVVGRHPASTGIISLVVERRATVVMDDDSADAHALPELRDAGFRAVIASPVWSQGQLTAVLTVGSRDRREVTDLEREAVELLAAQAGRALDNAEQFEAERRSVEHMEELHRMKEEFLSSVSHEIRTPLTIVEGTGLTLEQQWDNLPEATRLEFLRSMNENSRALDGIVSKLLDFSRLETGKLEVHPQTINVHDLLEGVASRLSDLLSDHVVHVEAPADLDVVADAILLDRVVENLVSNAAKYTPPGTGILVSAQRVSNDVTVSVTDHGPGMPPEEVARLGERFFRGGDPNSRTTKGIGLGLALTRRFLLLNESDLHVESNVGQGSRFWFRLPVPPGPSPDPDGSEHPLETQS